MRKLISSVIVLASILSPLAADTDTDTIDDFLITGGGPYHLLLVSRHHDLSRC